MYILTQYSFFYKLFPATPVSYSVVTDNLLTPSLFIPTESPLDLSQPLLHPIPNLLGSRLTESFSPVSTLEDRISVSSDSGVSSSEETDISGGRSSVVTGKFFSKGEFFVYSGYSL